MLEHPSITRCLATGYPWPDDELDGDEIWELTQEDAAYDERREREAGWLS